MCEVTSLGMSLMRMSHKPSSGRVQTGKRRQLAGVNADRLVSLKRSSRSSRGLPEHELDSLNKGLEPFDNAILTPTGQNQSLSARHIPSITAASPPGPVNHS